MKYLPLIWAGVWRKPARTLFTFLSIVVAFVLFGILTGMDATLAHLIELQRQDRLYTLSAYDDGHDARCLGLRPKSSA